MEIQQKRIYVFITRTERGAFFFFSGIWGNGLKYYEVYQSVGFNHI